MATKDLEYYLRQVRRIAEHREAGSEEEIRKIYKSLDTELKEFLGDYYSKYAVDDKLTIDILTSKQKYARFMEEVTEKLNIKSNAAARKIMNAVKETYKIAYDGVADAVNKSKNYYELKTNLKSISGATPDVIKNAVSNTFLEDALAKNHRNSIYDIKQNLYVSLVNGDRFSTTAKRLTDRIDVNYRKAVQIARTETHRVRESGMQDASERISQSLDDGWVMTKTWKTMQDEAVRPQRRYKTKKGWKTSTKLTGPNHVKMHGVTVLVDEMFDLGNGVFAKAPGQSGVAGHDINCRCYLSRDLMTKKEFAKLTGRTFEQTEAEKIKQEERKLLDEQKQLEQDKADAQAEMTRLAQNQYGIGYDVYDVGDYIDNPVEFNLLRDEYHNWYDVTDKDEVDKLLASIDVDDVSARAKIIGSYFETELGGDTAKRYGLTTNYLTKYESKDFDTLEKHVRNMTSRLHNDISPDLDEIDKLIESSQRYTLLKSQMKQIDDDLLSIADELKVLKVKKYEVKYAEKHADEILSKKELRKIMDDNGIVDTKLELTTDVDKFDDAIIAAKKTQKAGACVDTHPKDELENYQLFLSKDGMTGVAVKPDGDITCVFKNSNSKAKGAANDLIITARANGGTKMDCYGRHLVNTYEQCGYVPVARIPFNPDYTDDAFLLATKPDVYVMMKNTDDISTVVSKNASKAYKLSSQADLDNLPVFDDYDEALKYRDALLARQIRTQETYSLLDDITDDIKIRKNEIDDLTEQVKAIKLVAKTPKEIELFGGVNGEKYLSDPAIKRKVDNSWKAVQEDKAAGKVYSKSLYDSYEKFFDELDDYQNGAEKLKQREKLEKLLKTKKDELNILETDLNDIVELKSKVLQKDLLEDVDNRIDDLKASIKNSTASWDNKSIDDYISNDREKKRLQKQLADYNDEIKRVEKEDEFAKSCITIGDRPNGISAQQYLEDKATKRFVDDEWKHLKKAHKDGTLKDWEVERYENYKKFFDDIDDYNKSDDIANELKLLKKEKKQLEDFIAEADEYAEKLEKLEKEKKKVIKEVEQFKAKYLGNDKPRTISAKVLNDLQDYAEKRNIHEYQLNNIAKRVNLSKEEAREKLSESLTRIVDDHDIAIRIRSDSLEKVLDSGEFKNLFETGIGGGCTNQNVRRKGENNVFGFMSDIANEDRPIYGMMIPNLDVSRTTDDIWYITNGPGGHYGDGVTVVVNKSKVRHNSSFTLGDSLDDQTDVSGSLFDNPIYNGGSWSFYDKVETMLDSSKSTSEILTSVFEHRYMEVQIHGKDNHSSDIIEKVYFTRFAADKAKRSGLIDKLEKHGIPYEILE